MLVFAEFLGNSLTPPRAAAFIRGIGQRVSCALINTKGSALALPLVLPFALVYRYFFFAAFFTAFFAAFFAGAFLAAFLVAICLFSLFDGLHRFLQYVYCS